MTPELKQLCELVLLKLDNQLSETQTQTLEQLLQNDQDQQLYLEIIAVCCGLAQHAEARNAKEDNPESAIDIKPLPETNKVSEIQQHAERQLQQFLNEQERLRKIHASIPRYHTPKIIPLSEQLRIWGRRLDRLTTIAIRGSLACAALLAILLSLVCIVQYIRSFRPVAQLVETRDAHWKTPLDSNALCTGWFALQAGFAEIEFNKGTRVLLQAPCEFKLASTNQMEMLTGVLSAQVPKTSHGFIVETPNSRVIDLGTEFGVSINTTAQSEIHVFKGLVGIHASQTKQGTATPLTAGKAAIIAMDGHINVGSLQDRPRLFVRDLTDNPAWGIPGIRFDLADVVGGGNGYGTGIQQRDHSAEGTLNPLTGKLNDRWRPRDTYGGNRFDGQHIIWRRPYVPNTENEFIDGTCVPDTNQGPCIVSSQGHIFTECPETDAQVIWNIGNGWRYAFSANKRTTTPALSNTPGIAMHANSAVTFDIEKIRHAMSGLDIQKLTAQVGCPSIALEKAHSATWVLVDGKVRFRQAGIRGGQIFDIEVDIESHDRFLTLVVTDSQTPDVDYWSRDDWIYFYRPVLHVRPRNKSN